VVVLAIALVTRGTRRMLANRGAKAPAL
jgi:hypothetical protein